MRKRLLASLLSLAMLLTMLPVTAFASNDGDGSGGSDTGTTGETTTLTGSGTETDPFIVNVTREDGGFQFEKPGLYQLPDGDANSPIEITFFIGSSEAASGTVTLDLNGRSITPKAGSKYQLFYCGANIPNLTITNSKAETAASTLTAADGQCVFQMTEGATSLKIEEGVTLKSNGDASYGIFVTEWEKTPTTRPQITLDGCKFTGTKTGENTTGNGITVNGSSLANPSFTLNGVTMNEISCGIYQAGIAETTDGSAAVTSTSITNSSIDAASVGIEIRAGKLTLTNSTVKGGTGAYKVTSNNSGGTTENAGIAVAKHVTANDIEVNLSDDVKLEGTVALSVANPENISGNVTVNIAGGTYTATGTQEGKVAIKVDEGTGSDIGTTTVNVTGGTFSDDPTQWVDANTHVVVENTDKSDYTVKTAVTGPVTVSLKTDGLTTADTPPTASITSPETGVKAETKWYKLNGDTLDETSAVESFEEGTYKAVVTVSADTDYAFTADTKFQLNDATATSPTEATETFPLTSEAVTVTKAPVTKYAVTITQPVEGGTVKVAYKDENESPVETQESTSIAEGTDVTVTATPSSNEYTFDKITVTHVLGEGNESAEELTSSPETFTMPAHPVKISASFNPTTQPPAGDPVVTVTVDGNTETLEADAVADTVIENVAANVKTASVEIKNATGYTVTINETTPEEAASPYTVNLKDAEDTTITITLKKGEDLDLTYTVIVKKASSENPGTDEISAVNVTLDTSGPFVEGGSLIDATVTPSGDVAVDTKWYEGESTAPETSGTFSKAGTYKVEVTLTPNDGKTFKTDAEVTLNNKALESNVEVTKNANSIVLTISGISVNTKSDPSVTTPVTAVNVTLVIPGTLQVDAELIDAAATGGVKVTKTEWFLEGNAAPETGTFSKAGTYRAVVTMVADDGYQISADTAVVTLNNETFTDDVATVEQTAGQIVLTRKNVSVSDKPAVPHLITVEPSEGGSVSADRQEAVKDTEITITVEPDEGMELASLTVAAGDEILVVKDNKFTMPDADVTITATFNAQPVVEAPAVEADAPIIGDDNKAEVVISGVTQEAISQAIEDAKQAAESDDEAKPTVSMGTAEVAEGSEITADTASAISIPMDIVTAVADEALNQVALEAVTPIGSVTVPAYGVKNLVEQATESGSEESKITIRLDIEPTDIDAESEADPIVAYNVEFKKVAEDGTETHLDMDTAVFLKLWTPLVPRDLDKGLTVLLIDDTDKTDRKVIQKKAIPSGGMVGFLAPHLSIYATTDALNAEFADVKAEPVEPAPDVTPDPVEWVRLGKKQNESFGTIIIDGKKDCTYRIQLTRGAALGELTSFYVVKAAADGEFELTVTNKDIISIYEYGPTDTVYSKTFFNDPVSGRGKVTLTIDLDAYTD